jgi:hypothetical protein
MSFLQSLRQMAGDLDAEFGTDIFITGALTSPNKRAQADPARPRTCIPGIYHEATDLVSNGGKRDGMKEVNISTTDPTVSIMPERLCCRKFRVIDIKREMHTRQCLVLEDLNRIPAR